MEETYENRLKNTRYIAWATFVAKLRKLATVHDLEEIYGDMVWDVYLDHPDVYSASEEFDAEDRYHDTAT